MATLPVAEPQPDEGVTYAHKIEKAEAAIDFSLGALAVDRAVRAFNPAPGAFVSIGGERIKLLEVAVDPQPAPAGAIVDDGTRIGCGEDSVRLRLVQRPGKRPMNLRDFLNGFDMPTKIDQAN